MPEPAGSADGRAVSLVRRGQRERCLDLVLVADGFEGPGGRERFARQARAVVAEVLATEPLGRLRALINVDRVDPGEGPTLVTGRAADDERLLLVDQRAALDVAGAHVPGADVVLVVVDSARYGGSGGTVAATTCHPRGPALAVHELGHAAFDLADEYGRAGHHPGPEPARVNVTLQADPRHVPWADLVHAGGDVGRHEGGDGYARGVYRPSARCRMRALDAPFCAVCAREIRRVLLSYRAG